MTKLESRLPSTSVRGVLLDAVTVVNVQWHGSDALTLIYRGPSGRVAEEISTAATSAVSKCSRKGRPWSFDGDGVLFRVSETHRIRLAHLFDPVLAVHTSLVEPLPHQITAVYEAMLRRQPLRFLLADDSGAVKTVMAGCITSLAMLKAARSRSRLPPSQNRTTSPASERPQLQGSPSRIAARQNSKSRAVGPQSKTQKS
jgi:hypothetical protein